MEGRVEPILKKPRPGSPPPNLIDYETAKSAFTWEAARRELDGLPDGKGLNIAHEAVDRHADGPRRKQTALRCLGKNGEVREFTYRRSDKPFQSVRQCPQAAGHRAGRPGVRLWPAGFRSSTSRRSAR
ncbi:MAG: hypothetical protein MPW14_00965 [Candidatus Manganitrophus sp.]|nr:MAG: hypothetical protein MPW14_00965 [Candidatus Manganitrophus sp.]